MMVLLSYCPHVYLKKLNVVKFPVQGNCHWVTVFVPTWSKDVEEAEMTWQQARRSPEASLGFVHNAVINLFL